MDYNSTVNLPKTDFPMRAALPKREPDMLKEWYDLDLYHEMLKKNEGRAMHKSLGNGVYPDELIPKYGADLIRLWAASTDYRLDVRCSDAIFKQLSDKYLKIRNTARYILGNLNGFDPDKDAVALEDMPELDRWALSRLDKLIERCLAAYERYEFFTVTSSVHSFCVLDMSNFYRDLAGHAAHQGRGCAPRHAQRHARVRQRAQAQCRGGAEVGQPHAHPRRCEQGP